MSGPTSGPRDPYVSSPEGLVPTWLVNLAALGWRVLVIVALAIVLWYLGSVIWNVLASIALAIIVAVVLAPFVLRLRAGGRSRTAAAGIAWAATLGVGLGLLLLLALAFLPFVTELVGWLRQAQEELAATLGETAMPAWLQELVGEAITAASGVSGDALGGVVGSVANLVGILVLASFLLFFFLRDGDKAWMWLFQAVAEDKFERITSTGDDALARVGGYVRSTTVQATIASVSSFVFMIVLGVPLALPLAVVTFITAYIPYFGGAIAGLAVLLVTLAAVDPFAAVVMAILLLGRWLVVRLFVRPRLFEGGLTVHPVLIIIVLPIGLHLGGLVGLILAVPLTAVGLSVAQATIAIMEPDSPADLPEIVPAWLDRAAQLSWRAIVAIVFVAGLLFVLTTLPLVVLPLIVALILAATILPLVEALVARGQSRGLASAVAVGGSTVAILGVLALSVAALAAQADEIGATAVDGAEAVDEAADGQLGLGVDAIEAGVDVGVDVIAGLSSELVGLVMVIILSVLLTFYFLRDGAGLWGALMSHLPADAARELSAAGTRSFGVLSGYMVGTGAISFVGAASQAVIMWVLGLPLVMPVFVLSLFGGYIPYIGSLLTTGLAFLIAVAVGDTIDIVIMLIWTLVFNIVQGNIVAPLVYHRTTSIHPAIVLASIPAGSAVAGILGMFLVVPVLGVVAVSWHSMLRIMGSDVPEPPADETGVDATAGDEGRTDTDSAEPAPA